MCACACACACELTAAAQTALKELEAWPLSEQQLCRAAQKLREDPKAANAGVPVLVLSPADMGRFEFMDALNGVEEGTGKKVRAHARTHTHTHIRTHTRSHAHAHAPTHVPREQIDRMWKEGAERLAHVYPNAAHVELPGVDFEVLEKDESAKEVAEAVAALVQEIKRARAEERVADAEAVAERLAARDRE